MNNALLKMVGAQPTKPSKFKPIWTDRWFTGYFSNRNPLRSPLSAFYADGWGMGKTDTLEAGDNIEVSPRLTLIRRPGNPAWTSFSLASAPLGFYGYHVDDGTIQLISDLAGSVNLLTAGANTSIYTKPNAAQNYFYGLGDRLLFCNGYGSMMKWKPHQSVVYQAGVNPPSASPTLSNIVPLNNSNTSMNSVVFNGSAQYATTATDDQPATATLECWFNTSTMSQPIVSLESAQSGASTNVGAQLWIDATGNLQFSLYDSGALADGTPAGFRSAAFYQNVADGNWHQACVQFTWTPNSAHKISRTAGPSGSAMRYSSGLTPIVTQDAAVPQSTLNVRSNTLTGGSAWGSMYVTVVVDGQTYFDGYLSFSDFEMPYSGTAYWRIANATQIESLFTNAYFTGSLREISVFHSQVTAGANTRYKAMLSGGTAAYESALSAAGPWAWWKLNETTGTTMGDAEGHDAGTYVGSPTLNSTSAAINYVAYAASTAYTVGQVVVDSNGMYEKATTNGTTGASAPAWPTTKGGTVVDGSVTWQNIGAVGITLTKSRQYGYSYGTSDGNVSSCSPLSAPLGPETGVSVTINGVGSTDPQVTTIWLFATPDGGSIPYLIAQLTNPSGGAAWSYTDYHDDSQLNVLMPAPLAHQNDPPPQNAKALAYYQGRVWCAVGNVVYASSGPDAIIGDGNECWPPANTWVMPEEVIAMLGTTAGLLIFTTGSVQVMQGGPAITSYFPMPLIEHCGILSQNAIAARGTQISLFTTDFQLVTISAGAGFSNNGFAIADKLAALNPANVYLTYHVSGLDHALYLGDGSTGWYRAVLEQPPDYQMTGPVWSPKSAIVGGCGALKSVEVSPGVWKLLIGSTAAGPVLYRDSTYSTFTDNGTFYPANVTVGSIVLAQPGERAEVGFIAADFVKIGSQPQVSILLDEISGTFESLNGYVVADPPIMYGQAGMAASLFNLRFYTKQTVNTNNPQSIWCKHLQIHFDFGSDTVMNELLSQTVWGAIQEEGGV